MKNEKNENVSFLVLFATGSVLAQEKEVKYDQYGMEVKWTDLKAEMQDGGPFSRRRMATSCGTMSAYKLILPVSSESI